MVNNKQPQKASEQETKEVAETHKTPEVVTVDTVPHIEPPVEPKGAKVSYLGNGTHKTDY